MVLSTIKRFFASRHRIAPARTETMAEIFSRIYEQEVWGRGESRSGTGSDLIQTRALRAALPSLIKRLGVGSILDVPCGDFHWMQHTHLGIDYIGADAVPEIVAANGEKFTGPGRRFIVLDITQNDLPDADLIFCRDLLVHFSFADAFAFVKNIKRGRSDYLLTTTFTACPENIDVRTGLWRPLNLEKPPFDFPRPLHVIDEECREGNGEWRDKSLGLWHIRDL